LSGRLTKVSSLRRLGLSERAVKQLRAGGCSRVAHVLGRTTNELLRLPYMGRKVVLELDQALEAHGFPPRPEVKGPEPSASRPLEEPKPPRPPKPPERRVTVQLAEGELELLRGWLGLLRDGLSALAESARASGAGPEVVRWLVAQAAMIRGRHELFDRSFYQTTPAVMPEAKPVFMTRIEAADYLRQSEATLRRWQREGHGPRPMQIGRKLVYEQGELIAYARSRGIEAGEPERDGE
jgi:hypothetical protein